MPKITIIQVGTGKKAEIPETFTEFLRELINSCWDFDPKQRPSFSDILQMLHYKDFKLFDLNDHEINEIHNFVEMYSKTIPRCFKENKPDTKIKPQEEEKKFENIKILVIRDMDAGDTSFIRRYYRDIFSESYKCTIGVEFAEHIIDWNYNTKCNIQMWDIIGQELYGNRLPVFLKESYAAFIVFDVTRPKSLDVAVQWKEEIDKFVCTNKKKPIPVVLIANKIDLIENNLFFVTKEQIENFVSENNFVAYFRTSCRFRANVREAVNFQIKYILTNDIKPLETDASQNNEKDGL
ncbi:rab32, member RAS oncoprotein [Tritrichomonas musculus]|uniref:Rab32, member RAS oncoprotein n=1 Tax=Tritrichomonas musculus TaxID=1915356 RepID=A0ABR2L2V0_9EUKA